MLFYTYDKISLVILIIKQKLLLEIQLSLFNKIKRKNIWLLTFSNAIFVLTKFNNLLKCYQERQRD